MSRKLALTGIISLFERGSISQAVLAACISFFFFALTVKEQPYSKRHLNLIKIFTEAQLFGILLVIIVLQTNDRGLKAEKLQENDWGVIQIFLTVSTLPVILFSCAIGLRDIKDLTQSTINNLGAFANPMAEVAVVDEDSDAED